jgi:4-alpha-glucanotransferase
MNLHFYIDYQAAFGEELVLNLMGKKEKGDQTVSKFRMKTEGDGRWTCNIQREFPQVPFIDYYYAVERDGAEERHEWLVAAHRLELNHGKGKHYTIYDHWIDTPEDSYLYSSAFTDCMASRKLSPCPPVDDDICIRLKVRAPQLRSGQRLALVGEDALLGAWDVRKAIPMVEHNYNEWVVNIDATRLARPFIEFKFVVLGETGDGMPIWEDGMNRTVIPPSMNRGDVVVYELTQAFFPIHNVKCAGTLAPVFSLRSKTSFGVGDFGDLRKMIDWVAHTRQRVLQILPINDTTITHTWTDSYPYSCISIFALHPQYADLTALPALEDESQRQKYELLRQELNALPQIDYERVNQAKTEYLQLLFAQEGKKMMATAAFKAFFDDNKQWLAPYAQYCTLRDQYGTADYSQWQGHETFNEADRKALESPRTKQYKEVAFFYFVQFILSTQMQEVHQYARQKGVILKGDIPIGVNRFGCDAWQEPRYFNLNGQAGAPPDDFSADGQNWGFPTYNWDEMLKDNCLWWVRRFSNMAKFFDAYRIDHVLGFFRIWEIPMPEKSGLMGQFQPALGLSREEIEAYGISGHDELFLVDHKRNDRWHPRIAVQYQEVYERLNDGEKYNFNRLYNDYFYRRNNQFWYREAMKKLPRLVQATRMLVCAEDLGMVPDCVPWVMNELRILSLELQSMPKDPNCRFGHLSRNPYRSVCTISSHDMPTLRQWWDEDEQRTQEYYSTMLYRGDAAPHPLPGWLARDIISRHLTSPSMLCILSIQDWLAMDEKLRLPDANAERINIPANPKHYWRYRMHLNIEDLMNEEAFNENIKELIQHAGRK